MPLLNSIIGSLNLTIFQLNNISLLMKNYISMYIRYLKAIGIIFFAFFPGNIGLEPIYI